MEEDRNRLTKTFERSLGRDTDFLDREIDRIVEEQMRTRHAAIEKMIEESLLTGKRYVVVETRRTPRLDAEGNYTETVTWHLELQDVLDQQEEEGGEFQS